VSKQTEQEEKSNIPHDEENELRSGGRGMKVERSKEGRFRIYRGGK
jgi:hypothetical protein